MIQKIETIEQYNRIFATETRHPLVTVVDVEDYAPAASELTQFITRHKANSSLISRFEHLVDDYLANENLLLKGQPTVAWCASELCLSANYFGDLVRKELGSTAKDFIKGKIIDKAKQELRATDAPITIISDRLGFSSVSHFTRLFKAHTGKTPSEYRQTA